MIACMTLGVTENVDVAIGDFVCDWGLEMRLWLVGGNDTTMGGLGGGPLFDRSMTGDITEVYIYV